MQKLTSIQELRDYLQPHRSRQVRIGLVPTMGAIHEGHRALMRAARADCGQVVVSIFVNPTQFAPGEDFDRYPRPIEADLDACRVERVDGVFCPSVSEIYPAGNATRVVVDRLTDRLCGPGRPDHFTGVATVVAKLFSIVRPDAAYFGQKDAQQVAVIRRMIRDLFWPIDLVVCPTVREPDGLAISSRNAYLDPAQRQQALCLFNALEHARRSVEAGRRATGAIVAEMRELITSAGPCTIDYIDVVDPDEITPKPELTGRCLIALAVRIGHTRLIDNLMVDAEPTDR